ncbi:hypothetical protein [Halolamina sp.]|jgi:phosphatidylserine synthase|uniref:DUF7549 family protein n=1 Tax=Halolamina sp. TaxID=1940283 RepID=UPI000223B82F|nr:hypothetical protein Halar_1396 [halophilic archaeon DL31]
MVWVRSEYAGELAVLTTWFTALVPWNIHYAPLSDAASVLWIRFPLFQVRYVFGLELLRGTQIGLPVPPPLVDSTGFVVSAIGFQDNAQLTTAYEIWAIGALVYLLALGISIAYYRDEARVESWSVDPVRLLGGLLLLAAGSFGVATVFTSGQFPGVPIPLGAVLVGLFGAVLLTAERRADDA